MSRQPVTEEIKVRDSVDKAIADGVRTSYISPSYLAKQLQADGIKITRQLVTRRYHELGITFDRKAGLWVDSVHSV